MRLAATLVTSTSNRLPLAFNGPATTRLTNENCSPVSVHYAYDTYALAHVTGSAIVKAGGATWFFGATSGTTTSA